MLYASPPSKTALRGFERYIEFYTDQERDASTGLYNYDARLYDPVIGRFLSADSIVPRPFDPQALNRYSYCYNNPLRYVDPSGHMPGMEDYRDNPGMSFWDDTPDAVDDSDHDQQVSQAAVGMVWTARWLFHKEVVVTTATTYTTMGIGLLTSGIVLGMPSNSIVTAEQEAAYLAQRLNQKAQESLDSCPVPGAEPAPEEEQTKGSSEIYDKDGSIETANEDFDSIVDNDQEIRELGDGMRVGSLPDGRTVIVRNKSTDGRPTIEVQRRVSPKKVRRVKVRYNN